MTATNLIGAWCRRVLRRVLRIHSLAEHFVGTCWCNAPEDRDWMARAARQGYAQGVKDARQAMDHPDSRGGVSPQVSTRVV